MPVEIFGKRPSIKVAHRLKVDSVWASTMKRGNFFYHDSFVYIGPERRLEKWIFFFEFFEFFCNY